MIMCGGGTVIVYLNFDCAWCMSRRRRKYAETSRQPKSSRRSTSISLYVRNNCKCERIETHWRPAGRSGCRCVVFVFSQGNWDECRVGYTIYIHIGIYWRCGTRAQHRTLVIVKLSKQTTYYFICAHASLVLDAPPVTERIHKIKYWKILKFNRAVWKIGKWEFLFFLFFYKILNRIWFLV